MTGDPRQRLSVQEQDLLRRIARPITVKPGEAVFGEGDAYRGFFVVESGCFKVFRINEAGKEAVLSFFLSGQAFALLPLLKNLAAYPAACMALQHGRLSLYEERAVRTIIEDEPALLENLRAHFVEVAEFFRDKAAMLMLESAEQRVCSFLRSIGADNAPTLLEVPKGQLALFLGITPEAFSRALAALKKRGVLMESEGLLHLSERQSEDD